MNELDMPATAIKLIETKHVFVYWQSRHGNKEIKKTIDSTLTGTMVKEKSSKLPHAWLYSSSISIAPETISSIADINHQSLALIMAEECLSIQTQDISIRRRSVSNIGIQGKNQENRNMSEESLANELETDQTNLITYANTEISNKTY